MGDHGPRREGINATVLGHYELNNPFLVATVPKQYRNTEIHERMREKSNQLMTNFDLHATLMDIMKFGQRYISIFISFTLYASYTKKT
ncbi:hypothetical protein DICVIV_07277 [Dictyocaulus viviparus]|uniref:Uncharacterized protein n=1 Tax=Dictyocaulus viviparus TaxID=29172 RepID=A0A0D8XSE8_DICVI|nr:hypothetical protein DICVIV_07277 [Dictyocaulus viviparus]